MAITEVNLCYLAPSCEKSRNLFEESFTANMPLLMATNAFRLNS